MTSSLVKFNHWPSAFLGAAARLPAFLGGRLPGRVSRDLGDLVFGRRVGDGRRVEGDVETESVDKFGDALLDVLVDGRLTEVDVLEQLLDGQVFDLVEADDDGVRQLKNNTLGSKITSGSLDNCPIYWT